MRKVSETVVKAFLAGESKKVANTSTDGETLFLYGNKIATNIKNAIRIFDGGFQTTTTKERLNALIQTMNRSGKYETIADGIYQKDFTWYIQFNNGENCTFRNDTIVGVLK